MTETAKTLTFMAAGAVALLAAFAVVPSSNTLDVNEYVGQRLNEFDVDKPKRLKIVKFDAETAEPREFEVAEDEGLWTIPSKDGYPADATSQMAEAANCLIDREILRIASTSRSEHAALGVINPSNAKLSSEADGVGTRVIMSDNEEVLTDMIVGKPVRDAEGQYHVRNSDQDIVYVVELDPSKLTTRFEDWIEDDLLKINPFDIRRIEIKDYTAELMGTAQGIGVKWDRRAEMALDYDNTDSKWTAESLKKFDTAKESYVDYSLAEDEELNQETLNKLRDGLDDLLLVDVERKPEGLSADLKAGQDFVKDNEAALNLMQKGFAPIGSKDGESVDILSTEGEVVASLQDGVEYVLRFGNLQMESDGGESKPAADAATGETEKSKENINRYLFVMARFNESLIEKPELDELPELPEGAEETAETEKEESDETAAASGQKDSNDESTSVDGENGEESTGEPASAGDETAENADDESAGEPASAGGEETEDAESEDAEAEEKSPEDEAKAKEIADIIAARKEIEQENQRRLDEYQAKIEEGKKHVAELNERFGDWYYVISDDVFKQVHLSLNDVVKKKGEAEKKDEAAAPPASGIPGLPNLPLGGVPAGQ
jgi:hypothetical protein